MIDWPIDRIDTHIDDALDRFTSQYAEMDLLKGAGRVWAERIQEIEDSAYQLLTERWVDDAIGDQLDRIGETVGESRQARNDSDYRAAIKIRIGLNSGSGEPETVIFVMQQLLSSGEYAESYPAGIEITVTNEPLDLQQQRGIVAVRPAGVRVDGVSVLNNRGISIGSVTMGGLTTTVQPFVVELLDQQTFSGRGVEMTSTTVAQVYPELPPDILSQNVNQNRFAAHGGTNTTQINPEQI